MLGMDFECIYFGHYGMTTNPYQALQQVPKWLAVFLKEAKAVVAKQEGQDALIQRLFNLIREHLRKLNNPDDHKVYFFN